MGFVFKSFATHIVGVSPLWDAVFACFSRTPDAIVSLGAPSAMPVTTAEVVVVKAIPADFRDSKVGAGTVNVKHVVSVNPTQGSTRPQAVVEAF